MSFPEVKWGRQVQLGMKCREVTSGWVPVNIHHKGGESQPDPGQWRAGWQASGAFGGPGHSLSLRRVLISPGRHLGWGRNPVVGMSRRVFLLEGLHARFHLPLLTENSTNRYLFNERVDVGLAGT